MTKKEKYKHLTGIIAPVVTPWTKDEKREEAFRKQVDSLLTIVHGISPAGSTGEVLWF